MRITSLALAALLVSAPLAAQGRTLDQVSSAHNLYVNAALPGWIWEQEVMTGLDGNLAAIELVLNSYLPDDKVTVAIVPGAANSGNAEIWTGQMGPRQINVWQPVRVDLLPYELYFPANTMFVIRVYADSAGMSFQGNSLWPNDEYPAGALFENGVPTSPNDNMAFQTWVWTGPNLELVGGCPGSVQLNVTAASPNANLAILHGAPGNFVQSNPALPCLGLSLYLSAPAFAGYLGADAAGYASLNLNLPAGACGRVVQMVDLTNCTATNPVNLQ